MKTVDLIYFNAGGGHRAAAQALEQAMLWRPWRVRLVNLTEVLDPQGLFQKLTGMAPEDLYNKRLASGFTLGLAQELKKPLLSEHLLNNIYFDTCVYHQPGIDLLNTVIPVKNVLFASEMIGAVRGIDPETGNYYDDTKRYIEASKILSQEDRHQIYEATSRRVFPRLDALLKGKGQ